MTNPILSIIIISYNTRDMTLACLASVYAQTQTPFEVIVVDNASSDGSADAIAAAYPQATVLVETHNHGFAGAHHIAMPHATAPWVLLLNPDTLVLDGALDKLLAFAKERPAAGIWGGRTVHADGTLNPYSCWGRMTLWSLFCRTSGLTGVFPKSAVFNPEAFGDWPRDTVREVDIVAGCLFLLTRQTWDDLGGLDPIFYMYGEEADLCLRAKAQGMQPTVTPTATIVHYGAASETVQADKVVRLLLAKAELIKRHFSPATRGLGRHLLRFWPLSRALALSVVRREKAGEWYQVWARRAEWQDGFAPDIKSVATLGGQPRDGAPPAQD
ncbi:MAG: glycosyltransferase family 2 protein [Yoonia sp.]|uniref:glycosyltransferase family 2 protein n=1 Tax=Yoonia sp. TaxID=2212373 RepID=UPI003264A4BF